MSKRLQVLLEEPELREIQHIAQAQRMTLAEWVRQALRQARRREPVGRAEKKIEILRAAVRHNFPSGDMATMLAAIERGYGTVEHDHPALNTLLHLIDDGMGRGRLGFLRENGPSRHFVP